MKSYVSYKGVLDGKIVWKGCVVPTELKVYIQQLENAIKSPSTREKLKKLYPGRFGKE